MRPTSVVVGTSFPSTVTSSLPMSHMDHDPENTTEEAQTTFVPRCKSALHLPPDTNYLTLARLNSIDRLLILLICLYTLCFLFLNCCHFTLYFSSFPDKSLVSFMVSTGFVPFFSWIVICCPCLVLVIEIRCCSDVFDFRLSFASHFQLNVDLLPVPL